MIGKALVGALGALALPAVAIITALGVGVAASTCIATASSGGSIAPDAPVPAQVRGWVDEVRSTCPDLPASWVAAVMDQESGFRPDAYADDANGGTWGLFQLNAAIWQTHYGHPWSADLNGNGVWDVKDPDIHATVAGTYLCARLADVRQVRAAHPNWASSAIPVLDGLIIAHNAGESRLRSYPDIPAVTRAFITDVTARAAVCTADPVSGASSENPNPTLPATGGATAAPSVGCVPQLGTGQVVVPPGTPADVTTAVNNAMAYVGVTSGWTQLCDRLACRAYGYVGSGYPSAKAHWEQMVATGHAHPGDRCPPLGSFVFFDTGRPYGHVSIVVQADPGRCDPQQVKVTSNQAFDAATGNHGGVYLLTFAQLNGFFEHGGGYLGWSDPVCRGAILPPGTIHPVPSGR